MGKTVPTHAVTGDEDRKEKGDLSGLFETTYVNYGRGEWLGKPRATEPV